MSSLVFTTQNNVHTFFLTHFPCRIPICMSAAPSARGFGTPASPQFDRRPEEDNIFKLGEVGDRFNDHLCRGFVFRKRKHLIYRQKFRQTPHHTNFDE